MLPLKWYYLDGAGLEHGPVDGPKMREYLLTGRFPPEDDLLVRLNEWERHFPLNRLWPTRDSTFVLPPAWPDVLNPSDKPRGCMPDFDDNLRCNHQSPAIGWPAIPPQPSTPLSTWPLTPRTASSMRAQSDAMQNRIATKHLHASLEEDVALPPQLVTHAPTWPSTPRTANYICGQSDEMQNRNSSEVPQVWAVDVSKQCQTPVRNTHGHGRGPSARISINSEIEGILAMNSTLDKKDFDSFVRQHLHAIHTTCGQEGVVNALALVHSTTVGKVRTEVRSWPAYLVKLLKGFSHEQQQQFETPEKHAEAIAVRMMAARHSLPDAK